MKTENTFTPTALPLFLTLSFPQPLVLFVLLVVLYLRCSLPLRSLRVFSFLVSSFGFHFLCLLTMPSCVSSCNLFSCRYSPFSPPIYCLSLLFHLLFLCSQLHLVFLLDYFFSFSLLFSYFSLGNVFHNSVSYSSLHLFVLHLIFIISFLLSFFK